MRLFTRTLTAIAAAAAAITLTTAVAATPAAASNRAAVDFGVLTELNDSGVHGVVVMVERAGRLRVNLVAIGLEPRRLHVHHIHGFGDGTQAGCPDMSLAGDDGVLSFAEGLPVYGPVVITLGQDVTRHRHLAYSRTFTTTDAGAPETSLGAFDQYVVVVHGMTNSSGFEPTQPVACAVIRSLGH